MRIFFAALYITLFLPVTAYGAGAVLTDPDAAGHPTSVYHNNTVIRDNSVIHETGVIRDTEVPEPEKRTIRQPLILDVAGIGDACTIGTPEIVSWELDTAVTSASKQDLEKLIQTALAHDTRLRRVVVADNRVDLYYLMPAYRLKVIPVNYHLHIIADSNTFRIRLENPKWVSKVPNKHEEVSLAFSREIPVLLSEETVARYEGAPLALRDSKMIEVIARTMSTVSVMPNTGTFFSCYILPFLAYIIVAIVLLVLILWYVVRRIRRLRRRQQFLGLSGTMEHEDDEDDDEEGTPRERIHWIPGNSSE